MTRALLLNFVLWIALASNPLIASESDRLSPEQVIQQELLLNALISDIYLLQLDFQDQTAREHLQVTAAQLTKNLKLFPGESSHNETSQLLVSSKQLWPVINQHIEWLSTLPADVAPPDFKALTTALNKYDHKLQILRQQLLTTRPTTSQQLRFLEQALLMQKMTKEYLYLSINQSNITEPTGQQLQLMARQFDQKMNKINQELSSHPHARSPVRQASIAWKFISKSIDNFPKQPVPSMVALYSDKIINQLSSIHNMF